MLGKAQHNFSMFDLDTPDLGAKTLVDYSSVCTVGLCKHTRLAIYTHSVLTYDSVTARQFRAILDDHTFLRAR